MSDERISLTKIRANPLDFLECASEGDLLALVEAVEAARTVLRVLDLVDFYVEGESELADALVRFRDYGTDNQ